MRNLAGKRAGSPGSLRGVGYVDFGVEMSAAAVRVWVGMGLADKPLYFFCLFLRRRICSTEHELNDVANNYNDM